MADLKQETIMRKLLATSILVPFVFMCATADAPTNVWKVGGASTHFTDLQPAVNQASDRDLILIGSGTYTSSTRTTSR